MSILKTPVERVSELFEEWQGVKADFIVPLPASGSYRQYFRLGARSYSWIGAWNADVKENRAFVYFSRLLKGKGLNVPEIYYVSDDELCWLEQDLGDVTLLSEYQQLMDKGNLHAIESIYRKALEDLVLFQVKGRENMDLLQCYPRARFDNRSMLWDLNYFKYYFLKFARIPFDEQDMENDFHILSEFLMQADTDYFLYRDFQSRNIMLTPDGHYYIDYQSARLGAAQYDPSSLLFEAKTHLPDDLRRILLEHYVDVFTSETRSEKSKFMELYYPYALIRQLQAMGAYGFRGLHEQKPLFLESIPHALNHIRLILPVLPETLRIPALKSALQALTENENLRSIGKGSDKLTVRVYSFSYRSGIPFDETLHGGGFVFDCRGLPNPGRLEKYKSLTGKDKEVAEYLGGIKEVNDFIAHAKSMVSMHINNYLQRGLTEMMVCFGCTGGRHRSVYCAEKLASDLEKSWPQLGVRCIHTSLQ